MDPRTDISDEAMAIRWGGILNEIPELWDAIRLFEIENRPAVTSGGFKIKSDWVSVSVDGAAVHVSRVRVGNARSME